ncbi:MAG: marine proteobacterial sortase target protein [Thermoanaerobaculia bacterium]
MRSRLHPALLTMILLGALAAVPVLAQGENANSTGVTREETSSGAPITMDQVTHGMLLLRTAHPGLYLPAPTQQTTVHITVEGMILRATVTQKFRNPVDQCVEGVYVFPLPEDAAVDHLRMIVGDRTIEGQIHERAEAKQIYEQAKQEGRKASLVEQERPNIFTTSIANMMPDDEVEVVLEYQQIVTYDQGTFHLRFPTVVAPRYIPGTPSTRGPEGTGWGANTGQVPDASRITPPVVPPGGEKVNPIELSVDLDAGLPVDSIDSPYQKVQWVMTGAGRYLVTLADASMVSDHDFELTWKPRPGSEPRAAVFSQLTAARSGGSSEHFVLLMLVPPLQDVPAIRLPKETVFVIDTSGSMSGTSIEQARAALLMALDRLGPQDTFNVIEFNSTARALFEESRAADLRNVDQAKRWVSSLQANGGTEMKDAIEMALHDDDPSDGIRQVIFMTDGQVGNESELFDYIKGHLGRSRLFTIGIGAAPNSWFMSNAAKFGRGTFTYIGSPQEVGSKMTELFQKLESPVLSDVRVQFDDPNAEVWPDRMPDLYAGEPLLVVAKLNGSGGQVSIEGSIGDRPWSRIFTLKGGSGGSGLDTLWAQRKIDSLMDRVGGSVSEDVIRPEVVQIALQHHLVSKFTSLVAVDVTPTVFHPEACVSRPVPVNLPAGQEYEKIFGSLPQTATPAPLLLILGFIVLSIAGGLHVALRNEEERFEKRKGKES